MTEQTLNIPQTIVFIIVTVLAVRWFFSKPTNNSNSSTRPGRSTPRINAAQIEQIAQMFPQLERRSIAWELYRSGGNVATVTEKVLSGRALETPPPTFTVPPPPRAPTTPNNTSRTPTPSTSTTSKPPSKPDLITRYNLSSKITSPQTPQQDPAAATETGEKTTQKPKTWSADRNERQSNLQRRREEMILAARRKMEEKDRAAGKA